MPKSLAKVQKRVARKKGNSHSLHENSRDAQKLRRAGARSEKLERLAAVRAKANQHHRERFEYFVCWDFSSRIKCSAKSGFISRSCKGGYRTHRPGESSPLDSKVQLRLSEELVAHVIQISQSPR